MWCQSWVDAARAKEQQLLAAVLPSRVDDVHLEDHIVVHEVRESRLVSHDAADLSGSEEDVLGFLAGEELLHGLLSTEIQLRMGAGDDIGVALALELTHDGGAYHAAMSCYVYFGVFIHVLGYVV